LLYFLKQVTVSTIAHAATFVAPLPRRFHTPKAPLAGVIARNNGRMYAKG
jgi:hypothetical protein